MLHGAARIESAVPDAYVLTLARATHQSNHFDVAHAPDDKQTLLSSVIAETDQQHLPLRSTEHFPWRRKVIDPPDGPPALRRLNRIEAYGAVKQRVRWSFRSRSRP